MRNTPLIALLPALLSTALAQDDDTFVYTLLNPEAQTVYVKYELQLDQPTQFRTSLTCKGTPKVTSVVGSSAYADMQGTRQDPALLAELQQNAALDTTANGFSLNLPGNVLHFTCENGHLVTDYRQTRDFGGSSNILLRKDGAWSLTVPFQARFRPDMSSNPVSAELRLDGEGLWVNFRTFTAADQLIVGVGSRLYRSETGSLLQPLALPASGVVHLYYHGASSWVHTVVDTKNKRTWTVPGTKPSGTITLQKRR